MYSVGVNIFDLVSRAICLNIFEFDVDSSCLRMVLFICNVFIGMLTMLGIWLSKISLYGVGFSIVMPLCLL